MSILTANRRNHPTETALHPNVNLALLGTLVWSMAAIWLAFGAADSYLALQLAIITFLAIMVGLVPYALFHLWQAQHRPVAAKSFQQWAGHEFQTASGPVEGKEAAVMVLLAPAAVALGLTVMSLIAVLAANGVL